MCDSFNRSERTDLSRSLIPRTYVMRSNLARSFVRSPVIHDGASRFRNYGAIAREICTGPQNETPCVAS